MIKRNKVAVVFWLVVLVVSVLLLPWAASLTHAIEFEVDVGIIGSAYGGEHQIKTGDHGDIEFAFQHPFHQLPTGRVVHREFDGWNFSPQSLDKSDQARRTDGAHNADP